MTGPTPPRINGYRAQPETLHHPGGLYRIRWTRERWERHNGGTRWASRLYVQREAAVRLAEGLLADGAQVEISTYALEPTGCVRYRPLPPPPPRRRPTR